MIGFKKKEIKIKEPEYRFYLSIDTLPFWNYEKLINTGDARYLLMLDYYDILPNIKVDKNNVDIIMIQCFEFSGGNKARNYILELSHIIKLRKEYTVLTNANYCLCYKKDIDMIQIIENYFKKSNPNYEFKRTNETEYYNSIIEVDRQCRGLKANIEQKEYEFSKKHKSSTKNKIDLYHAFGNIQRYYKMQLNAKTLTTRQFLEMNSTMFSEIQKQNGRQVRN